MGLIGFLSVLSRFSGLDSVLGIPYLPPVVLHREQELAMGTPSRGP